MEITPFLALALAGGYAFSTIWSPSLYHSSRESGHRLYMRAVFYAAFLTIVAILIDTLLFATSDYYRVELFARLPIDNQIVENSGEILFTKERLIIVLCYAFAGGPFVGHLLNLPVFITRIAENKITKPLIVASSWYQSKLLENAIQNNDFEKLLARSFHQTIPVMLTLQSNKVYVGWAVRAPNPVMERKSVRILPLASGYRDNEQRVVFTTDYLDLLNQIVVDENKLNHLKPGDIEIVLPVDQIVSSHLFDMEAHDSFYIDSPSEST